MQQYLDLLRRVYEHGAPKGDRTGTGVRSLFGAQLRCDLAEGFPLLTTKKVHLKSVVHELLWLVSGETNIRPLTEQGVSIWNEWADDDGDLGPVYGKQWRRWSAPGADAHAARRIDQLAEVIDEIRGDPDSRRLLVSAWNVADLPDMALPPCHVLYQFYVAHGRLSCQVYQRSADVFLGLPFNIASYALLTMMVAQVCDLAPGDLVHTVGDVHLYDNHLEQAQTQLAREPRGLPRMRIDPSVRAIDDFRYEHFTLAGYDPHPAISAPVAV